MVEQTKVSSLVEYSIQAAFTWIRAEYAKYSSKDLQTFAVTGPSMLRQIPRIQPVDGGNVQTSKLSYPYLLYSLGDISLDTARGGLNKRAFRNIIISKDTVRNRATMTHLRPIKLGIGISFSSSDMTDILRFANVLLLNVPAVSFYMDMKSDHIEPIGVKLNISESFTTPPVNAETPGEAYQFESVLTLDTFMGVEFEQGLIREVVFSVSDTPLAQNETFYSGDIQALAKLSTPLMKQSIKAYDTFNEASARYRDR